MATPHIDANIGDFAKTVLMPGDPLRSKFIAENFLSDIRLVNNVRGIQGYTGLYKITAIEDRFIPHSSVADALKENNLDAESMCEILKND